MSDQTIEITTKNIAFYYVIYCIQNGISVNIKKVNNYLDRINPKLNVNNIVTGIEQIKQISRY